MIIVTGASGGLGGLVLARLVQSADGDVAKAGVGAGAGVVAASRTPEAVRTGVPVRRLDFDALVTGDMGPECFAGAETVLLISAGAAEDDVVIARHEAAISAAEKAGVRHVVYTSLTGAGDHLSIALPHRWTERRLMDSSLLDWTILRNGLYAELIALGAMEAAGTGVLTAPMGAGRVAVVAREDLADAAAIVLADPGAHRGRVYELVGDRAVGGDDIVAAVARVTGKDAAYRPSGLAELREVLTAMGLPAWQVPLLVNTYSVIAAGFLDGTGGDLGTLLGHAPRPALEVIASFATPQGDLSS
ncbi:NmrA family NAD(P)-binding protein [Nonomuraea zeae]|uniref:NmrA family NAD(P)-binding protein n=1 Tax=Nonomuraea zeae TaxID=1642303 RepID=UPI0036104B65